MVKESVADLTKKLDSLAEEQKVKKEFIVQFKEKPKNVTDVNENLVSAKSDLETIKTEKESVNSRAQKLEQDLKEATESKDALVQSVSQLITDTNAMKEQVWILLLLLQSYYYFRYDRSRPHLRSRSRSWRRSHRLRSRSWMLCWKRSTLAWLSCRPSFRRLRQSWSSR